MNFPMTVLRELARIIRYVHKRKGEKMQQVYSRNGKTTLVQFLAALVAVCAIWVVMGAGAASLAWADEGQAASQTAGQVLTTGQGSAASQATEASTSKQQPSGPISTSAESANPLDYTLVIALDPGHGGSDSGASANGVLEKSANLAIAKACAAELQKYQNVKVYLTRTTDVYVGLEERVINAKRNGAGVFISLHNNAAGSKDANGTEVYYPNDSSYLKSKTHGVGKTIAQNVLNQLVGLGLGNRGIKTKTTTNNSTYKDGSKADYYSVIYNSRVRGIPGLIVEHAFVTNKADAKKLASASWLESMGKADARGIARAYNLDSGYWYKDGSTWKYWTGSAYMKNGWLNRAGAWYYFNSSAKPVTGLQTIKGVQYYFDKNTFVMAANKTISVSGKTYKAAANGALSQADSSGVFKVTDAKMKGKTGWIKDALGWHYYKNGKVQSGWKWINGYWYYLDPASIGFPAKAGLFKPKSENNWYYANANCQMQTGWVKTGGKWYYATKSGAMTHGWIKLKGIWYYLDPSTKAYPAKTGFYTVKGVRYYSDPTSCAMKTGWIKAGNNWYYANSSGSLISGWKWIRNAWYYLDPTDRNHAAKMDEVFTVDGVKYYADKNCAMVANKEFTKDGVKYRAASSGALIQLSSNKVVSTSKVRSATTTTKEDYVIMGKPGTTVVKMVAAYNKTGYSYPASVYKSKGAATINDFCKILYEEATSEGVRPEVVFAQSMKETGWLQFGGSVKAKQCNFAGIGATDSGGKPATFKDVRTGLRAQVQHLKAYASTAALKNACVDPRFNLVKRGCATTVINLGQKENPNGCGWATGKGYGASIINIMKTNNLI